MKIKIALLLIAAVAVPLSIHAYTEVVGGLHQYQGITVYEANRGGASFPAYMVTKIYDHDEGVLCYASENGISCLKD